MSIIRQCDGCQKPINQENNEFLEVIMRVLDVKEGIDQDDDGQTHGDFCDVCIGDGTAIRTLLKDLEWTLGQGQEERPGDALPTADDVRGVFAKSETPPPPPPPSPFPDNREIREGDVPTREEIEF